MSEVAKVAETVMPVMMKSDEYHRHNSISKTTLDHIHSSPHAVDWSKCAPVNEDKLKTLDFGDAMHAICLEPERLETDFAIMPDLNLRTNAGKAEKEQFEAENASKTILSFNEHKQLRLMFESIMAEPQAKDLIEADGVCEGSYFWTDEQTGLACRCRPDKEIESRRILVDVKTTDTLKKFCYSIEDYRYYVQDPFYCDGVGQFKDQPSMLFLVVQKHIECGKYPVRVVRLPEEAVMYGRMCYRADLLKYRRFLDSGKPIRQYNEIQMHYRFIDMCMENLEVTI